MANYFYITSKLNGNVMTVNGANTAPRTPIVSAPINPQSPDSQLWEQVPTGPVGPDGGHSQYYLRSKLNGFVLDITGSNTAPRTQLINYPTNSPASNNQIWQFFESSVEGAFYITTLLNGFVADITGSNTATGTPIISYPQNVPTSNNQLWTLVPAPQNPGKKKKAIPPNKKALPPNKKSGA